MSTTAQDRPRWAKVLRASVGVLAVGSFGVAMFFVFWQAGDEVGTIAMPGAVEVDLAHGDELVFRADTNILWRNFTKNAKPAGCRMDVKLFEGGVHTASSTCDLFGSIARSSWSGTDRETGMRHLRITGQRVSCSLVATKAGRARVEAKNNLDTCVPRGSATATVYKVAK